MRENGAVSSAETLQESKEKSPSARKIRLEEGWGVYVTSQFSELEGGAATRHTGRCAQRQNFFS